jgi:hypothetical protein
MIAYEGQRSASLTAGTGSGVPGPMRATRPSARGRPEHIPFQPSPKPRLEDGSPEDDHASCESDAILLLWLRSPSPNVYVFSTIGGLRASEMTHNARYIIDSHRTYYLHTVLHNNLCWA